MRTHNKAKFYDKKTRLKAISLPRISFKSKIEPSYTLNSHQWANKMEIMRQLSY